ncbi:TonB-dependent receptor [Planctobacterium marinum]|uniref:Oar protein n=1 Tax=Planctobacterium marinum TaxID=1631968 RepID=A0AA48HHG2_9ALTE|nr:Oar protein [Planctobacterium marinum]
MFNNAKLSKIALALALAGGLSVSAVAQETSSGIRGTVVGPAGNAAAGTTVTITHIPSGTVRTATVNNAGQFSARGLRVGGPYTIEVDSASFEDTTINDVYLSLGEPSVFNLTLEAEQAVESIVVTGSAISAMAGGEFGPSANFGLEDLQRAPAINRNITDIIRVDPRIYVDESRGGTNPINCAGKNSRFNSFTLDGVQVNDSFGLNSNGYPTERMPFPFDSIEQVAVELAPFDVQYGGFTACNINAVTKSGSNEIHGGFFYEYGNDSMRGDSVKGGSFDFGSFSDKRYGFDIGFPLLKDKLFAHVTYEEWEGVNLFSRRPEGTGVVNPVPITQAELDEIVEIANTIYGYDPGPIPTSLDNFDEKLLVKLDWNINADHRATFTYNYNDGNNFTESDGDLDEFEFQNHLYERGAELNSYVASFYSDWTDKFSTEIRLGYLELDNRQISVGGTDFGEIRIETDDVDVYIGGDDSRQSNKLSYDQSDIILKGYYYMDNGHNLTFGYEQKDFEVFNLFVQHSETEIRFDGIENFRNGFADAIYYNNAPSNNPDDAAAEWGYKAHTVYIQDEFEPIYDLIVKLGARYDWYTTSDAPLENPDFVADYGFSNSTNLDGEGLFQPRIGLTYTLSDDTTLRGGLGLYTGGNPNVWLSNNFSANNVLQFGQRGRSFGYTDGTRSLFDDDVVYAAVESGAPAGPGWGVPQELYDAVAGGVGDNFELNYMDPDFKLPSEWKLSLGVTHVLPGDYLLTADLLVSRTQDAAIVKRGDLEQVGTTDDGYPIYDSVREASFVLTNTDVNSTSYSASIGIAKSHDNGITWRLGYAYSDAEDVQPMTSSVAFSNYVNRAFFDPQEEVSSRSNYNIEHNFTGSFGYTTQFFDGLDFNLTLVGLLNSGEPYSFTKSGFEGTILTYDGTPWLDFQTNVLNPGVARNSEDGSWWGKVDLRVSQQIPGFTEGHKGEVYFTIDNLTNFLNDDWGVLEQIGFPNTAEQGSDAEQVIADASIYEIRLGVNYRF